MKKLVLVSVALLALALAGCSSSANSNSSSSNKVSVAKGQNTSSSKGSSDSSEKITYNYQDVSVLSKATYPVSYSDNSWAGTTVGIDKITVYRVKPFTDASKKTYQGLVTAHFKIHTTRDISIYPSQGTLVTSDGQQVDGTNFSGDDFDGQISKNVDRDGTVVWALEKMDDPRSLKTIRLKWSANYDTDDMEDDNANKDYDATINLQ